MIQHPERVSGMMKSLLLCPYNTQEGKMPRWIDICCPRCGFIEEVQKPLDYFVDEEQPLLVCSACAYPHCKELPPIVSIHLAKRTNLPKLPPRQRRLSALDAPLPEEVRRILAKELFDPCSCGDHAPADLDEHKPDCHVHNHSFMKPVHRESSSR